MKWTSFLQFSANQTSNPPKAQNAKPSQVPPLKTNHPLPTFSPGIDWVKGRRTGNIIIALGLIGAVTGVYYYTMSSISTNDFSEFENERKLTTTEKQPINSQDKKT
jgi:hypothetical protein